MTSHRLPAIPGDIIDIELIINWQYLLDNLKCRALRVYKYTGFAYNNETDSD